VRHAKELGGPAPPTPVSDFVAAGGIESAGEESALPQQGAYPDSGIVAFYVDGRRVGKTQHTLAYIAGYTRLQRNGVEQTPRISTARLTELLAEAGIDDPYGSEWSFTLHTRSRSIEAQLKRHETRVR